MADTVQIAALEAKRSPSVTDLVYEHLYRQVVETKLPPGAKLSEVEVARQLGVSRQPVRDAFYRLSQQGFLQIRPQRATLVTHISEGDVKHAHFIRSALEVATVAEAAAHFSAADCEALSAVLSAQAITIDKDDRIGFHTLDDEFHRLICELSGHANVWSLIRDHKAHMDRVRFLSLAFGARGALDEHTRIFDAIAAHDVTAAVAAMREHLAQIATIVDRIHVSHPAYFEMDEA